MLYCTLSLFAFITQIKTFPVPTDNNRPSISPWVARSRMPRQLSLLEKTRSQKSAASISRTKSTQLYVCYANKRPVQVQLCLCGRTKQSDRTLHTVSTSLGSRFPPQWTWQEKVADIQLPAIAVALDHLDPHFHCLWGNILTFPLCKNKTGWNGYDRLLMQQLKFSELSCAQRRLFWCENAPYHTQNVTHDDDCLPVRRIKSIDFIKSF